MLPHLVLIEQAVSQLFSICKRFGKGNCEKTTVSSKGGLGMAAIFGPGGLIILPRTVRGDCFQGGTVHSVTVLITSFPACVDRLQYENTEREDLGNLVTCSNIR